MVALVVNALSVVSLFYIHRIFFSYSHTAPYPSILVTVVSYLSPESYLNKQGSIIYTMNPPCKHVSTVLCQNNCQ